MKTSHPELKVKVFISDDNSGVVPLENISTLFCPYSCKATKALLGDSSGDIFYLHVYAMHEKGDSSWIPQHSGTSSERFLSQYVLENFAHLIVRKQLPPAASAASASSQNFSVPVEESMAIPF
jgi:hypothetical protein